MTSYVRAVLKNNSFKIPASITLDGTVYHGEVKIDTGCAMSVVTFRRFANADESMSRVMKSNALVSGKKTLLGFGVSDTSDKINEQKSLYKAGNILDCTAVKFSHKDTPINLGGFNFSHDICVNYDRTGNTLIGMDILEEFEFHCGKSLKTGEYIFLGCLRSNISTEYKDALREELGIGYECEFLAKLVRDDVK